MVGDRAERRRLRPSVSPSLPHSQSECEMQVAVRTCRLSVFWLLGCASVPSLRFHAACLTVLQTSRLGTRSSEADIASMLRCHLVIAVCPLRKRSRRCATNLSKIFNAARVQDELRTTAQSRAHSPAPGVLLRNNPDSADAEHTIKGALRSTLTVINETHTT
ncbi:hypothetical protein BDW22DRAFT_1056892 [Trametopsis cervina]|nr:hypothetical protein BDW22DRAFT_1056892 [Trametopsis cervina]